MGNKQSARVDLVRRWWTVNRDSMGKIFWLRFVQSTPDLPEFQWENLPEERKVVFLQEADAAFAFFLEKGVRILEVEATLERRFPDGD